MVRLCSFADVPTGKWEEYPYELNNFHTLYKEEMKHFLSCVQAKKETIVPVRDNVLSVIVGVALKQSFIERKMINVSSMKWSNAVEKPAVFMKAETIV
ncbi:MAG: hypothetical protein A3F11_10895 [Gammaproteobacteria bacterium RIFCSPHIGHO2_12_FULL_37_14]|nr:MAG: hypothetical protein A3F11_10895 [Gammaproteobacteria bacterium RIFCSPHIGHO2_12_FULL_37_14]